MTKPRTTASVAIWLNMVHLPRMTLLALAWCMGAADKRQVFGLTETAAVA